MLAHLASSVGPQGSTRPLAAGSAAPVAAGTPPLLARTVRRVPALLPSSVRRELPAAAGTAEQNHFRTCLTHRRRASPTHTEPPPRPGSAAPIPNRPGPEARNSTGTLSETYPVQSSVPPPPLAAGRKIKRLSHSVRWEKQRPLLGERTSPLNKLKM